MHNPDTAQLYIEISVPHATPEVIDRMTRQLLSELRQTDVESAELEKGADIPLGAKSGDSVTIGSIIISALPTVFPAVVAFVQAWAARGQGRTVKFKGKIGREVIEFEGSPEQFENLLAKLDKQKKKK